MSLPDFESLMLPVLRALSGNDENHIRAVREIVADSEGLSHADIQEISPGGRQPKFNGHISWVMTHLERAGLVKRIRRGVYQLTMEGSGLLREGRERIDIDMLLQNYPAYAEWSQKSSSLVSEDLPEKRKLVIAFPIKLARVMRSSWFLILIWVLIVCVVAGWFLYTHDIDQATSTRVRNLGLVIAATIALPVAFWRSIVAERQADTARKQQETAERGLLNERYQKGAEMLGSHFLSVRLGAIFALWRLAAEHPEQYHIQIMDLFCSFVRHSMENGLGAIADSSGKKDPRPEVRDVMTAITQRSAAAIELEKQHKYILNLRGANLSNLSLVKADISGAWLEDAILIGADLSHADLSDTRLQGANLSKTRLLKADLSRALLIKANLTGAYLQGTNMQDARLDEANLSNAELITVSGLHQHDLNKARSDTNCEPNLNRTYDDQTNDLLVWKSNQPRNND